MAPAEKLRDSLSAQVTLLAELAAQSIEPELERQGLSFGMFELLSAVRAAGNVPQAEIARRLGIRPPSLTEAVRHAVEAGLIEQVDAPRDLRSKYLRLTPRANSLLKDIVVAMNDADAKMVEGIGATDLRLAVSVLHEASMNLARDLGVQTQRGGPEANRR
ncbi:MAG: MarR family transcriptional regulator [Fimbriimonas ginsengisoli]|uniref:MarR family transcriptional regulator n=1 Tax=Fimbriimonas ginsengisoli TaxID=1005039 RepID=A0A931LW12_FIMGI|nr:MarR family transcriptional regulator [Fimbriimonas ginsengisoli]